jgi:aminoglycoside phosphotransferase (APT) family kinase protein
LALVEAHLKQPISLSAIQQEKQATSRSETNEQRKKLTLIRDFNRNLQSLHSADTVAGQKKGKRRGRKKADYTTELREAKIAADWEQARDAGTYKGDFARDNEMKVADLDRLLERVAKRKKPSE